MIFSQTIIKEIYMALSKKKLILLMPVLFLIYFIPLWFLPESVIGHRDESLILFISKLSFLAITAAIVTVFALILVFKNDFIKAQINTFSRFKYYLKLLIKRDFITKYRKSVLGVLWSLLNPILMMLVMTLVFSMLFKFEIDYFPVYLLSGQLIFNFFSESTTLAMNSVIASEGVIKKIYIPKYMFPLSKVISTLVQIAFSLAAFFVVVAVTGAPFHWTMFLIPIPIVFIFVFSLGIAMLISSLAVFFRDLTYLYGILTTILMYLSAIFWPVKILEGGPLENLIGLNPIYQFITYFRHIVYWGTIPDLWSTFVCIGFALGALCVGTYVFIKQQDNYILSL